MAAVSGIAEEAVYSEGVFVGYRRYDEHGIEPLFPFGHGLSYTPFEYERFRARAPAGRPHAHPGPRAEHRSAGGARVVQVYLGCRIRIPASSSLRRR